MGEADGGRDGGREATTTGNSHDEGVALSAKQNTRQKLPKEQEAQLTQLLKVLDLIPVIQERR